MRPNMVAKMWPYGPSSSGCVALQTICLRTHCRLHARIRDSLRESFGLRGGDAVPVLAETPLLYLLASLLDTSLEVIPVVGTRPEFDSLWEHQSSGNDV